MRTERQRHGFVFEDFVEKEYGVDRSEGHYTSQWDGSLNGHPVSIKTAKLGSEIGLADFRRNAENTESFYLFVGFWEGSPQNIVNVEVLFIDGKQWNKLFPAKFTNEFYYILNLVSNDRSDDVLWRGLIGQAKEAWESETSNLVRPRFKRDHGTQKRVQCAINYKDFYSYFMPRYSVSLKGGA